MIIITCLTKYNTDDFLTFEKSMCLQMSHLYCENVEFIGKTIYCSI